MVLDQRNKFHESARRGFFKVSGYRPGTGIGRFDVGYDPEAKRLDVTSRLNFRFFTKKEYAQISEASKPPEEQSRDWESLPDGPTWEAGEMEEYRQRFKAVTEATWSNQYRFVVRSKDWTKGYSASVKVNVEPNTPRQIAHYSVDVVKDESFRAMVAHEGYWHGMFGHQDIHPENQVKRDQALGSFVMEWMNKLIETTGCDFLAFEPGKSRLTNEASGRLADFAFKARRYLSREAVNAGVQIWVYAQTGSADARTLVTAGKRKKVIVGRLKELLRPFGDAVQTVSKFSSQPWIARPMKANLDRRTKLSTNDKDGRNFTGGMLLVKSWLTNQDVKNTEAPTIPRNYVVVAHEYGHMLGLPDEYFGVHCNAMLNEISKRQDLLFPAKLAAPSDRLVSQQEGFAQLLKHLKVPAPIMGTSSLVTDSIMYAGSQVLPSHYATFYGALLNCTFPYIQPNDWDILPDRAGNVDALFAG